jgi:hypothetical protein
MFSNNHNIAAFTNAFLRAVGMVWFVVYHVFYVFNVMAVFRFRRGHG